jgi:hypothetical protein
MWELERTQLDGGCILYAPPVSFWRAIAPEPSHSEPALDREVMPFGKCRGWCLHEVVTGDVQYARWLMAQNWFEAKYPTHYQYFAERLIAEDNTEGPSAA